MALISGVEKGSLFVESNIEALRQYLLAADPAFQETPEAFTQRMRSYKKRVAQWSRRGTAHHLKQETLIKAVGRMRPLQVPYSILDATAGCGKDSLILAGLGYPLICVEKSFMLATLLTFAWQHWWPLSLRACSQVIWADSLSLDLPTAVVDIVYLDPLFPHHSIQASRGYALENQWVRQAGYETQSGEETTLLSHALRLARQKVIVKRPSRAYAPLAGQKPAYSLPAGVVKFDIYVL